MAYIAISEGGDPVTGRVYAYTSPNAADTSPDIFKEDPVFGCVDNLRDFFAKSDLRLFSERFCVRLQNYEQLWEALLRRAVPGRVGGTPLSRTTTMTEETVEVVEKAERVKKELLPVPKRISKDAVITRLVQENPKRGRSAETFDKYVPGMTVREFVAAGGTTGDVRWDIAHGYIQIEQADEPTSEPEAA